jgi:hypothetical protein
MTAFKFRPLDSIRGEAQLHVARFDEGAKILLLPFVTP